MYLCVFIRVRLYIYMSELVCGGQRSIAGAASQVLSVLLLAPETGNLEFTDKVNPRNPPVSALSALRSPRHSWLCMCVPETHTQVFMLVPQALC